MREVVDLEKASSTSAKQKGVKPEPSRLQSRGTEQAFVAKVGTCGFGMVKAEYARSFSCIEIQHTFYQPPRIKTLEGWRNNMPADFEFVIKAWQLITRCQESYI